MAIKIQHKNDGMLVFKISQISRGRHYVIERQSKRIFFQHEKSYLEDITSEH